MIPILRWGLDANLPVLLTVVALSLVFAAALAHECLLIAVLAGQFLGGFTCFRAIGSFDGAWDYQAFDPGALFMEHLLASTRASDHAVSCVTICDFLRA